MNARNCAAVMCLRPASEPGDRIQRLRNITRCATYALSRSTAKRSSPSIPPLKKWIRNVFAVLPGIAIAALMGSSPSCRLEEMTTGTPSPVIPAAVPFPGHAGPLPGSTTASGRSPTRRRHGRAKADGGGHGVGPARRDVIAAAAGPGAAVSERVNECSALDRQAG